MEGGQQGGVVLQQIESLCRGGGLLADHVILQRRRGVREGLLLLTELLSELLDRKMIALLTLQCSMKLLQGILGQGLILLDSCVNDALRLYQQLAIARGEIAVIVVDGLSVKEAERRSGLC